MKEPLDRRWAMPARANNSGVRRTERLWSPIEVADFLGIPLATIYALRYKGIGPSGFRVGRHVRYDPQDVHDWLETQRDRRY